MNELAPCSEGHPLKRLWVDFNELDSEGRLTTLKQFGPSDLAEWDHVTAYDGDGTQRHAIVYAIHDSGIVSLIAPLVGSRCGCGVTA